MVDNAAELAAENSDDRQESDAVRSTAAPRPGVPADTQPLLHRSEELLGGRREAWIEHAGQIYRLRVTAAGRLYLTK